MADPVVSERVIKQALCWKCCAYTLDAACAFFPPPPSAAVCSAACPSHHHPHPFLPPPLRFSPRAFPRPLVLPDISVVESASCPCAPAHACPFAVAASALCHRDLDDLPCPTSLFRLSASASLTFSLNDLFQVVPLISPPAASTLVSCPHRNR